MRRKLLLICLLVGTSVGVAAAGLIVPAAGARSAPSDASAGSMRVAIEIDPWSDPNVVKPAAPELLAVAVLGSSGLDVRDIERGSLRFGPSQAEPAFDLANGLVFALSHRDVDGDGEADLVAWFHPAETGIVAGVGQACVSGQLVDGTAIGGCDSVLVFTIFCGLGFELVLVLPPLVWLIGHLRRRGG